MPTVVELPGNVEVEFPDGMGFNDINQAIGNHYAKQDPIGLAIRNRFGQFEVGGPLGGNAGALDTMFDMAPIIGDYRAGKRAEEASKPQLTPNLLGGATAGVKDPYTLAFESATMLPVMGDVAAVAKAGAGLAPMLGMMGRQSDPVAGSIAQALRGQRGLIGYHGSPHKFSKFDHSMMGSGEGAQAYGWGTYIAERPGTARTYINPEGSYKRLSGHLSPKTEMAYDFLENGYTDSDTLFKMQEYYGDNANFDDIWGAIQDAQKQGAGTGNLYEVDLPDERIAQMLDWDAPLSEQPDSVRKAVNKLLQDNPDNMGLQALAKYPDDMRGEQIYERVVGMRGTGQIGSDQAASEALNELGIPGIKYWDGGSRSSGSGTRNFVVFDEKDMTILKRNDEAIGLPMDEASRMARAKEMGFDGDMYHATYSNFDEFKKGHKGASFNETSKMGHWFADTPEGTEGFITRESDNYVPKIDQKTGAYKKWDDGDLKMYRDDDEIASIMPVKSRAKKPLVFESDENRDAFEKFMDWRDEWADYGDKNSIKKHKWGDRMVASNVEDTNNSAREWLKQNGYDSIQIKNTVYDAPDGKTITQTMIPYGEEELLRSKFAKFDPAKKNSANLLAGGAAAAIGANALMNDDKPYR